MSSKEIQPETHSNLGGVTALVERTFHSQNWPLYLAEALASEGLLRTKDALAHRSPRKMPSPITIGLLGLSVLSAAEELIRLSEGIDLGKHLSVYKSNYKYPKKVTLSDSQIVKPGQEIGVVTFVRNIRRLSKNKSSPAFSLELKRSGAQSLCQLAKLCIEDDPRLKGIDVFYGETHLAEHIRRFGFDVFSVPDIPDRIGANLLERTVLGFFTIGTGKFLEVQRRMRQPQQVFMSRKNLISRYLPPKEEAPNKIPQQS